MRQLDLFAEMPEINLGDGYSVAKIDRETCVPFFLEIHYAHRIPSVSYAYGLFLNGQLEGVVSYGTPASSTLCRGVCGDDYQKLVVELNRLVLRSNRKNEASRLIAASFRLLPKPLIIVSFADTEQKHSGIVYQATNFIYTGLSAKFKDPKVKGLEHQHHATYARGLSYADLRAKFGEENVYFVERSRKHRYIKFLGSRKQIAEMTKALRYTVHSYPK